MKRYLNEKEKLQYEYLDKVFDNGNKINGGQESGQDVMLK